MDEIALLDKVQLSGHETSVISTYNAYMPFYEEVVLRRLVGAGCRHNIVLMDAAQCARALATASLRPHRAGRSYTLIPVPTGGAFHPKVILLGGAKRATLFAGSHNLTLMGFGRNHELTTEVGLSTGDSQDERALICSAWAFLRTWVRESPAELLEALDAVEHLVPLLQEPAPVPTRAWLVGSEPDGPSLWERVRPLIPTGVRQIVALAPFFDRRLEFIQELRDTFRPEQFVVGVAPKTTVLDADLARHLEDIRFVNASELRRGHSYLHAKALLFQLQDGREVLISGSANMSHRAWLAEPGARNAEAVVVRLFESDEAAAPELGLTQLLEAGPLTGEDWQTLSRVAQPTEDDGTAQNAPLFAIEEDEGFVVSGASSDSRPFTEARLWEGESLLSAGIVPELQSKAFRVAQPDAELRRRSTLIELLSGDNPPRHAIVHHVEAIMAQARTGRHRELYGLLLSLDGDAPDLEHLLPLVEKVLFEDPEASSRSRNGLNASNDSVQAAVSESEADSLGVDLDQLRKPHRRVGRAGGSELGLLLDALIFKLGLGLDPASLAEPPRVNEEQLKDSEDEALVDEPEGDGSEPPAPPDPRRAAAQYRYKSHRLISRLIKQLEKLATRTRLSHDGRPSSSSMAGETVATGIMALSEASEDLAFQIGVGLQRAIAVIGLLRRMRRLERVLPWMPADETLVTSEDLAYLMLSAGAILYAPRTGLARAGAMGGLQLDELSALHGLMTWVACDTGLDIRSREGLSTDDLKKLGRLHQILMAVASDADAERMARESLIQTRPSELLESSLAWLDGQLEWARTLLAVQHSPALDEHRVGVPRAGDMAYSTKVNKRQLHLVLEVKPDKLVLLDLDDPSEQKKFKLEAVKVIRLTGGQEPVTRSAESGLTW